MIRFYIKQKQLFVGYRCQRFSNFLMVYGQNDIGLIVTDMVGDETGENREIEMMEIQIEKSVGPKCLFHAKIQGFFVGSEGVEQYEYPTGGFCVGR